jgi:hypothetical protein
LKNQVDAILARNLAPTCPVTDRFGTTGRRWLGEQLPPHDERRSVDALVRQLDVHGEELKVVDAELARDVLTYGPRRTRRRFGQSSSPGRCSYARKAHLEPTAHRHSALKRDEPVISGSTSSSRKPTVNYGAAGVCVADQFRQRLLHDPVHRRLDGYRQPRRWRWCWPGNTTTRSWRAHLAAGRSHRRFVIRHIG